VNKSELELLSRLSKPVIEFDKLENKIVCDFNKKYGKNFSSIKEIRDHFGWSAAKYMEREMEVGI
jgi:hypothetical protein